MIRHSIEINRPAEEVFAYLDQLDRHSEWQDSLVSAGREPVLRFRGICSDREGVVVAVVPMANDER